ncbi:MAG: GNAT family N-acetyltransferase [Promicromonosporaceae bacterium]|nr:GNAT family N-acetyltransferase [Promicromonosporaceae bacterium]
MNYTINNTISYKDYCALREAVNWRKVSERQFESGLKHSHYIAVLKENDTAIGLIKAVGDMGYYWVLADLIVHPDYQGQGLGRKLVEGFLQFADDSLEKGENVFISLLSAKGKESFYEKFGFKTRPYGDMYGAGMSIHYEKS